METQAAIVLNIDKICRVCLQEKEDAVSIFSFIFMQDISHRLSDVIIRISNMKIAANDGLPQIICKNCVATAYIANNFYLSCIRSSEILQEYLNKVNKECKQEPIEEVEEEEGEIDFILTNDCKEEIIDEEYACDSEIERNDNYDKIQCFSNHLNNNNTNKENSLDENFSIILNEIKTEGCRIRDVEMNNLNPLNIFEDNQSDNGTHGLIINGEVNDNNNETNPKEKKLPHKKGSEIKDKMFECQYCYRSIKMRVFSLHMRRYHMNQKEIIDIYTLPRDSKERRREILRLREILGGKNSRRHVEAEDKIYKSCEIPNSKAVRNSSGYDVNKEIITPATMEEKQIEKFVAVPPKKKKVQNNNRLKKNFWSDEELTLFKKHFGRYLKISTYPSRNEFKIYLEENGINRKVEHLRSKLQYMKLRNVNNQ